MIKSQKFSFYLSDSSRDSSLILDDISNYAFFKQIYKKMSFCTVKTSVDNWECDLNSVEIEKQTIMIQEGFGSSSCFMWRIFLVLKRRGHPFLFSVRFHHGTGNDQVPLAAPRHHSTDERCRPDHKFTARETSHRRLGKRKFLNFIVFSC